MSKSGVLGHKVTNRYNAREGLKYIKSREGVKYIKTQEGGYLRYLSLSSMLTLVDRWVSSRSRVVMVVVETEGEE